MNKAFSVGLGLLAISLAGCASGPTTTQAACEAKGEIPVLYLGTLTQEGEIAGCMSLRECQKREQLEMSCMQSGGQPNYGFGGQRELQGYGRIFLACDRPDSSVKVRVD